MVTVWILLVMFTPFNSSKHIVVTVMRHSTLKMCQQLCQASTSSFNFIKDDQSCRRIISNDSKTEENSVFAKPEKNDSCSVIVLGETCETDQLKLSQELKSTTAAYPRITGNSITLYEACEKGNLNAVKFILCRGLEDINCRGKMRRTPVMVAVKKRRSHIFDYLLDHGCDMSCTDVGKNNLLHIACSGGSLSIVRKLLVSFDIDSRGYIGMTPVMIAALEGKRRLFDLLMNEGCNLTKVDDKGHNILHWSSFGGNLYLVKHLMTLKAVEGMEKAKNNKGETPMQMAKREGYREIVSFLKEWK